jgi:serine/threonine protein kinase
VSATAPQLGRYRLEEVLGHGGMALVYRAWDDELERPVAVKLLADNLARDEQLRRRFLREARTAARLAHPNIVEIYDSGELDGRLYIVMEYVEGKTLAEILRGQGPLPPAEATQLALQLCAGLDHAHERGIVHRDIKPQNLLVQEDDILKIADFGIAKPDGATTLTEAGGIIGTAAYLAPEQLSGEVVTPAADIYALGVVLYEMLTGRPPYEVETITQLIGRPQDESAPPVRELAPEVPPDLEAVTMRCLARLPRYRPATAADVARQLEPETQRTAVLVQPHKARPRWAVPATAAGVVLALGLGLGFALTGNDSTPKRPSPPQIAKAPVTQARDLASWLRSHSR